MDVFGKINQIVVMLRGMVDEDDLQFDWLETGGALLIYHKMEPNTIFWAVFSDKVECMIGDNKEQIKSIFTHEEIIERLGKMRDLPRLKRLVLLMK